MTQPPHLPAPHGRLYRSRRGWFLGVCQGLAEWRQVSVGWIRLAVFIGIWLTGLWPGLAAYVIAGLLMKPAPMVPPANEDEQEFYDAIARSRSQALRRLKRTFDELDRRTQRIEDAVTRVDYDWQRRLDTGR